MRGHRAYNHPAFDLAAAKLRAVGHEVFSPAEEDRRKWPDRPWSSYSGNPEIDGIPLEDMRLIIKSDLVWICDNAEAIALLPQWETSKGVAVEKPLGHFLKIPVAPWSNFL
jgi:hypothetical protein